MNAQRHDLPQLSATLQDLACDQWVRKSAQLTTWDAIIVLSPLESCCRKCAIWNDQAQTIWLTERRIAGLRIAGGTEEFKSK